MTKKDLIAHLCAPKKGRPNQSWSGSIPWDVWRRIAALTERVEFGCKFEGGRCHNRGSYWPTKKLCCANCAVCFGHGSNFVHPDEAEKVADLFDERDGFWREGAGCVLPRWLRSYTCLTHRCVSDEKNWDVFMAFKELVAFGEVNRTVEQVERMFADAGLLRPSEEKQPAETAA